MDETDLLLARLAEDLLLLARLAEDLLLLARLDGQPSRRTPVNLAALCASAVAGYGTAARST